MRDEDADDQGIYRESIRCKIHLDFDGFRIECGFYIDPNRHTGLLFDVKRALDGASANVQAQIDAIRRDDNE